MAKVSSSVTLGGSPDQVWTVIRDVGNLADWFPALTKSWMEGEDKATRICVLPDGGKIVERIESTDDKARSYTYRIEDSPLPLSSYRSTLTVTPSGAGSQVEWRTEFEPEGITEGELHDMLKGLYDQGLASLKTQFGG